MDYKKKYFKYKNKYLRAKNILKTGGDGSNTSYPSMEEKQKQKNAAVERLEESQLKQINDCINNTKIKKAFCNLNYKNSNYTLCLENLIKDKSDCLKKAIDEFRQFTRAKVEQPVKIKEEKVLKDIINNLVYESRKNEAIKQIMDNPNITEATKQFLIENL